VFRLSPLPDRAVSTRCCDSPPPPGGFSPPLSESFTDIYVPSGRSCPSLGLPELFLSSSCQWLPFHFLIPRHSPIFSESLPSPRLLGRETPRAGFFHDRSLADLHAPVHFFPHPPTLLPRFYVSPIPTARLGPGFYCNVFRFLVLFPPFQKKDSLAESIQLVSFAGMPGSVWFYTLPFQFMLMGFLGLFAPPPRGTGGFFFFFRILQTKHLEATSFSIVMSLSLVTPKTSEMTDDLSLAGLFPPVTNVREL